MDRLSSLAPDLELIKSHAVQEVGDVDLFQWVVGGLEVALVRTPVPAMRVLQP